MMRKLTKYFRILAVSILAAVALSAPAHADDTILWKKGWCYEDEGMAIVISFYNAPKEQWPAGNHLGYDVRCMYGPGLDGPTLKGVALAPHDYPEFAGVPGVYGSGLRAYWGLTGGFLGTEGTIKGWGTILAGSSNVNRFWQLEYSAPTSSTVVVPQFAKRGSGGGGGPDLNPTPSSPKDQTSPKPDQVKGKDTVVTVPGKNPGGSDGNSDKNSTNSDGTAKNSRGEGKDDSKQDSKGKKKSGKKKSDEQDDEATEAGAKIDQVFAEELPGETLTAAQPVVGGPVWVWTVAGLLFLAVWSGVAWVWFQRRKQGQLTSIP